MTETVAMPLWLLVYLVAGILTFTLMCGATEDGEDA